MWELADPNIPHPPPPGMRVVDDLQPRPELALLMTSEDGNRHHKPGDFMTFFHTRVMAPLTPGVARAVPEVAIAPASRAGDAPIGGAPATTPIPGLPVLSTEIM